MKAEAADRPAQHLLTLAVGALPGIVAGAAVMLDQSMRRPSLVRVVFQSVQMAF